MFGKIIDINENILTVENLKGAPESQILNYHVVFMENDRKIVGEIIGMNSQVIKIMLIGEIRNDIFTSGVSKKPTYQTGCRIITKKELESIIGSQDINHRQTLLIGTSNTYENFKITTHINDFFSNHFAIIGNTGSGKSCGVARVIQNIFYNNAESLPTNAHIILFDVYGEYNRAFEDINKLPRINFKSYTTDLALIDNNLITIPAYFLEVDDLAILLNVTETSQLPIIENALKLVYIFTSDDPKVIEYKNDIIAKSIQDILASGKSSTQVRDQIVAVLTQFNTETLNLDTIISQPGYNRTLRQCLNIDAQGKMNSVGLVVDFLDNFTKINLDRIELSGNFVYTLDDLYRAFEFALINEGILSSEHVFDKANTLKVRLQSIINSNNRRFFDYPGVISKEDYIKKFFLCPNGEFAQLVNMNFSHIDERFAKVLTKMFAKLFFNYTTNLEHRASFPIHLILEEAHRYVQNDNDINIIGYNIFDRITKEGRKYGTILGFITQRPSELSTTALSQCSNFLVFRMFHPEDLKIISSISSNVTLENIEKIKTLRPGTAMAFGTAFKVPLIAKLDLPNPMPESTSVDLTSNWFK